MPGLKQSWPLTAERLLDHAAQWRPDCEIVARAADGQIQRTSYGALGARVRRLATALSALGVKPGDRVGVLGANGPRALEAIYAAIGLGAVAHPLAPGLPPVRLAALIDQAQDVVLFVDPTLLSGLDETLGRCGSLRHVVVMEEAARLPQTGLAGVSSHETLIAQAADGGPWGGANGAFGEADPCVLFHTVGAGSGTPKGVLWPHRSTVLAALIGSDAEGLGFTADDVVLPLTPFWRSGAWGLVFAAPAAGCKLVLPGPRTDAASVLSLIQSEAVTFVLGSPSEIQALADQMKLAGRPKALRRLMIAGAACPPALIESLHRDFGIEARCAWGMVEACGLGAIGAPGALRPPFGIELEIADASGNRLPHDGTAIGRLKVRGPAATAAYYPKASGPEVDAEGYLDTGDLAAIDANGRVRIADRADEVLSAGGAWVSPRAIEAIALEHPATADAAVISFPDDKGADAPLLVVRRRPGATAGKAEYLAFVAHRLKGGQKPADAIFVDALPLDIAGRIDKRTLRDRLERHRAKILGLTPPPPLPAPTLLRAPAVPPAPLLYSPELEPRAGLVSSEFAPLPAPPAAPPAPPAEEPTLASAAPPAPAADLSPEAIPAEALVAAIEAPAAPKPVEAAAAADAPIGGLELPAEDAAAAAGPMAPDPDPVAPELIAETTDIAEPAAAASEASQETAEAGAAPAAEAAALGLAPVAAEALAGQSVSAPAAVHEPDVDAPFVLPPAPARRKRPAPQWARIVLALTLLIAFVPALLALVGVIGVRAELIDWRTGVNDLGSAWPYKAAMVGVVSGILALFTALLAGFRKLWRSALLSLIVPLASLGVLAAVQSHLAKLPPIHDVATDWKDPVLFSPALIKLRGPQANPVEPDPVVPAEAGTYMYRRVAEVNADTCPLARPLAMPLSPDQAYARAKAAVQAQGLELVIDDPAHGRLEATARSPLYGLKSDLAVRVAGQGPNARLDMRAVSREGQADRGANCDLIGRLAEAMQTGG